MERFVVLFVLKSCKLEMGIVSFMEQTVFTMLGSRVKGF